MLTRRRFLAASASALAAVCAPGALAAVARARRAGGFVSRSDLNPPSLDIVVAQPGVSPGRIVLSLPRAAAPTSGR